MANKRQIEKTISEKCSEYGKNIYLLGTASLGPTNEPILIRSVSHLYSIFGLKGSLIDAYKSISADISDLSIYCCKVSGSHSGASLNVNVFGDNVESNALVFKSKCSNSIYNDILINLYNDSISFTMPEALGGETVEYKYYDHMVIGDLVSKINLDTDNGVNHVYARTTVDESTRLFGALDTVNPNSVYMYGATNSIDTGKTGLYYDLKESLDLLDGKIIDIIVPLEMYMDDIELDDAEYGVSDYGDSYYSNAQDKLRGKDGNDIKSYYNLILKFCAKQLDSGIATLGVIGYNPTLNMYIDENIDGYVKDVILKYADVNKFDKKLEVFRPLVSIVAGDLVAPLISNNINSCCQYAALLARSDLRTSPTNSPLSKSMILFNEFDNAHLTNMSEHGVVAFRHSIVRDRVVVSSAVTSADSNSEMFYVQNVRMAQFAVSCLYDIFENYIGEDLNSLLKGDQLRESLTSGLNVLITKGMLSEYKLDVRRTGDHTIEVKVDIKTEYMIEFVTSLSVINTKEE